jgi:cytochrome c oxidase subunit 1
MPRRYADYTDGQYFWNKVSSMGSFITVMRVMLFVLIIWEGFSTQRCLLSTYFKPVSLEWAPRSPISFHSFEEAVYVSVPPFSLKG